LFIVTGASSGIGQATAHALAQQGYDVVAIARSRDRLHSLRKANPHHVDIIVADLSSDDGVNTVLQALQAQDDIDGVVHAAGSTVALGNYASIKGVELLHHLSVHVAAPMALNNGLQGKLGKTRILYIDSYSAGTLRVGWAAYSIVKSAAQMAARAASAELVDATVIRVFPGGVHTPLIDAVLSSPVENDTKVAFKAMDNAGELNLASDIGEYIANILIHATDEQLAARECWDFNRVADRIL